jgi:predicted deacylase
VHRQFLIAPARLRASLVFLVAGLAFHAIAGAAGTRSTGTLAPGTPSETAWFGQDSGLPGPVVMILGGIHGDEPAGAYAAEQIRHWPIVRGRIILVPRANEIALKAGRRNTPGEPSDLGNLNRNFPKVGEQGPARGEWAQQLWAFVEQHRPDWLLDLHEGYDFRQINPDSVGSSVIVHPTDEGRAAAALMLSAVNAGITNAKKQFIRLGPPVNGSLARAAGERLGRHAMILETTKKDQPLSLRARQHRVMVHACLKHLGLIDDGVTADWITDRSATRSRTMVALYDEAGSFGAGVPRIVELLDGQAHIGVVRVGPEDIRSGALDQFDVVIFTGGSGSKQAEAIGERGREQVREFVERGGGYVGICAGAYLACEGFSWGVKILDARTVSPKWKRGSGTVTMELTEEGRRILGDRTGPFDVRYVNGPILKPSTNAAIPDFKPLALFRTELAENDTPPGVMIDSPAVAAGECGRGRVIAFSPHPEQTDGLEGWVIRAVEWVGKRRN